MAEHSAAATSPSAATLRLTSHTKPQRVLACVLCQQRKIKCDRQFPCSNCARFQVQCVPAATLAPRPRRRRFPERELLDQISCLENLLRQNNIAFEQLHKGSSTTDEQFLTKSVSHGEQPECAASPDPPISSPTTAKSEVVYQAKDWWKIINQKRHDSDHDRDSRGSSPESLDDSVVRKGWDQFHQNNNNLIFGLRKVDIDLAVVHPEQVHIFKLWQVYLDNVNPILKITHTPTLQGRIIDAASNTTSTKPALTALMFGIYCTSVLSLTDEQCHAMFDSSKDQLLARYQFGCEQALLDSAFLRTSDRECLSALYLYLISVRPSTDPQTLASMLSIAIRVAQRMGLHSESSCAKYPALEAEMRRRLWWSLVLFDTRTCELAGCKIVSLVPTWDCKVPLNVNDFDLQPEAKDPPAVQGNSTEAQFAVVRSELGNYLRHSAIHLDMSIPALKAVARDVQQDVVEDLDRIVILENLIEDKYLKFCNPGNPIHFMSLCTARGHFARYRLFEHYSRASSSSVEQTDAQRDLTLSYAMEMLKYDTSIMTSPLLKGYHWFMHYHFPMPAYIHIAQETKRRPMNLHAEEAWQIMSDNQEARFGFPVRFDNIVFKVFGKSILQAWEAREAILNRSGKPVSPPRIVTSIRQNMVQTTSPAHTAGTDLSGGDFNMNVDDPMMFMPMGFGSQDTVYGLGSPGYGGSVFGSGQALPDPEPTQPNFNVMGWS